MLLAYLNQRPVCAEGSFIAPSADLIGRVTIGPDSSVFFGCVLRADINTIEVGERSNIQDNSTLHVSDQFPVSLGDDVSVGHNCIIHASAIGNRVLVGMGSVLMDGSKVGDDSIIGAHSLIAKGKHFPPASLILGNPAKLIRSLTQEEILSIKALAEKYVRVKNNYLG